MTDPNRPIKIVEVDERLIPRMSLTEEAPSIGRPVDYKKAEKCILAFKDIMLEHGFDDHEYDKDILIKKVRKITMCEHFLGSVVLSWVAYVYEKLKETDARIKSNQAKLVTQLKFGYYTEEFLTDSDLKLSPTEIANKMGRITVFVVPDIWDAKGETFLGSASEAYDFGSLQP